MPTSQSDALAEVLVRDATPADAGSILRCGAGVGEFVVSDATVEFWPPEVLARAIVAPEAIVLVAEPGDLDRSSDLDRCGSLDEPDDLVGFLIAGYNAALGKAVVENIFVRPGHRRLDAGGQLLAGLVDRLMALGCLYIATLVPPEAEPAVAFYERHGFAHGRRFLWLDRSLGEAFTRPETPGRPPSSH